MCMSRIDEDQDECNHQDIKQGVKGVHGVRLRVFMDKSQELGFFLCVLQYPYYNCKCAVIVAIIFYFTVLIS